MFFTILRDKLKVFFTDNNFHFSDRLHDVELLTQRAYLGDVFSRLKDLNLSRPDHRMPVFSMVE